MPSTIGLDIGGANLKAAHASGKCISVPFPLWRQPEQLSSAIAQILQQMPTVDRLAITMTGELCDCFATKREGVHSILSAVRQVAGNRTVAVWSTAGHFVTPNEALQSYLEVAAANWHALATYAARYVHDHTSLLIDIGSTTTDIIPLVRGRPATIGRTDTDRHRNGELVYTGVIRTPVCALLGSDVFAEFFATTRDVYLLLDQLPEGSDCDTADGRPATKANAHARMARMIGGDSETISLEESHVLATTAARVQMRVVQQAVQRVLENLPEMPQKVILAGSGEFLAQSVARESGFDKDQMISLSKLLGQQASIAACAYSVAQLLDET